MAEAPGEEITASALARDIHVSPGTVTGIIDRLSKLGLVTRERREDDRRRVYLALTSAGHKKLKDAPQPLQERFVEQLAELAPGRRAEILSVLQDVVELMGAGDLDAAPILTPDGRLPDVKL